MTFAKRYLPEPASSNALDAAVVWSHVGGVLGSNPAAANLITALAD